MSVMTRNVITRVLIVALCALAGCERATHVKIDGKETPRFVLSGSGRLACFVVYSPDYAEKAQNPWDENFAVWKITHTKGPSGGTPVGTLDEIVYGVLPEDYTQVKPNVGAAPPLIAGQKYFYEVETTNAPGTSGYFEIRNSRAVSTEGSGPCFGTENNQWVRVPCPRY